MRKKGRLLAAGFAGLALVAGAGIGIAQDGGVAPPAEEHQAPESWAGTAEAFADEGCCRPGWRIRRWLSYLDSDQDGIIELSEIRKRRARIFASFDTDRDGVVTRAELAGELRRRAEMWAERLGRRFDLDGDSRVTREEFDQRAAERFSWWDLNDDGKITPDELPDWISRRF